jgi:flagellin
MSFSIQTNIPSLVAQENLRVNNDFQARTISRLTSGYRINTSGDDAAGLAVANKFRSDVAELVQGVRNANDGLSQFQIVDGGLNNISKTLDRLKTLATQSASSTFTGNRATLNEEFQQLLDEIDRQSATIGMNAGGKYNKSMSVYIGGGSTTANAKVSFDLSGAANRVDAAGLNLTGSSISASGVEVGNVNTQYVTTAQTFTISTVDSAGAATSSAFTYTAGATVTAQQAIDDLNAQVAAWAPGSFAGISFAVKEGTTSKVVVGGNTAFHVAVDAFDATDLVATTGAATSNKAMYWTDVTIAAATGDHSATFTNAAGASRTVSITAADTVTQIVNKANTALAAIGIHVVQRSATGISIMSEGSFTYAEDGGGAEGGFDGVTVDDQVADGTLSVTAGAEAALAKVGGAVTLLGTVQGRVGAAQNKLQYAIQLAQAQIASFSAAESRIRDADVAAEAANLTKAQVLQQAALAAMAQANSAPQAVLGLLRG